MKKSNGLLLPIFVFIFTIIGLFISCTTVKAETFNGQVVEGDWIPNVYIKKIKSDGTGRYQQARWIRRSTDGAFVYCLQPFVSIDNDYQYQVARSDYEAYLNMSKDQFRRVSLLAYYGYGYTGHSDTKWYYITQVMIWRTVEPTAQIYFTDTLNGNRNDSLFSSEIAELENLVSQHFVKPNFGDTSNLKLTITNSISLNDSNGKLNEFEIESQSNVSASISGNTLNITATGVGNGNIKIVKKDKIYSVPPIVYFNDYSQNVMRVGSYDPIDMELNLQVIGGKVAIQKVDSKTLSNNASGDATLKGAVYGVFKEDGTKLTEITTDNNGYAKSDYLPTIGRLYVQELKPSTGYKLDSTKYYVDITGSNLEPTVQVMEEVIEGKIKVMKYDSETNACKAQGEATLKGAKYRIIDSKGNVVDTLTISDDCSATSKSLPYGNYKVVEESSSVGYYIDVNTYNVSINAENTFITISKENVIKGRIKVLKLDNENNSCVAQGQAVLKGAVYEILDLKGNVVDTITIGDDCSATSKYLPYGRYKIKEKTQSKGYYLDTNIYNANITQDNIINITSKEQVIKNYISILKQYDYVNETTQFLNAEANIKFEIYYPDGRMFDTITTDKNGYATLDIPYGVWKFHQVNTNTGYEKIYDFYITVNETSELEQYYNILNNKISAYLQVFKKDVETGKTIALADATFKILNVDTNKYISQYVGGKVYSEFKTDNEGKFITYLKLEAGNYKLIEISSPKGYLLDTNGLPFTIGNDTHYNYTTYGAFITVSFNDTPIKGQVEINKTGEKFTPQDGSFVYTDIALKGVVFNIYAEEDIKTSDGQHIYYNKGTLVDTITTDDNGYAISKKLPLGKYFLVEVETLDNYILNTTEYHFELTEKDNKTAVVYESYSDLNKLKKGEIDFTKTDLISGDVVANTKIEIYTEKDELIFKGETDNDGKIKIKELSVGKYYIIETEPSTGYVITNEKVFFEVKSNGEIVKASMTNKPIIGKLEFTKVDVSTSEPLPNTTIEVYNSKDELIFSGKTDNEGKIIIENLRYGKYYILEKEAPEGYVLNTEKMYFEIKDDGEIIKSTMTNEKIKGTLEFTKIDLSTSEPLPNTLIEIYNEKDELVFSDKTDKEGKVVIEELEYGKYYIIEKEAPEGYVLNTEKMWFEIRTNGEIVKSEMTNEKIKGTLEFTKTDVSTSESLPNTLIEIYNEKDELIFSGKTDEKGKVVIEELEYGKYYIIEKEAPEGYVLNTEKMYFEIKDDGEIIKSTMTNEKIKGTLEFTKIDVSTSEPLPNTTVEIYNEKDELIFSGKTDESGQIIIEDLEYGKYYILEKEAPEGYEINPEKMWFEIKEDGEIIKSTMTDEKIIIEVPDTDKDENYLLEIACGLFFIAGIGLVIYANKKSKEE